MLDSRLKLLSLKTALGSVLDLVLPRECCVCDRMLLPSERHICLCCLADLPKTYYAGLEHNPMANRLNEKIASDNYEAYARAAALFHYDGSSHYRYITIALKYRRNLSAGRYFAHLLGEELASSTLYSDVDLVVPVPLHFMRQFRRGYNQAEVIAREVAAVLNANLNSTTQCETRLLQRRRYTKTQTLLSGTAKSSNVQDAFRINKRRAKQICNARHILLIDDVFTSGATSAACYKALRSFFHPSTRISVATLAFVSGN